jgi:putative cardiolipin synthase
LVSRLNQKIADDRSFPFKTTKDRPTLERFAEHVRSRLVWGKATLLADMPDKPETSEPGVIDALRVDVGQTLQHELLLESAYFVPAEQGAEHFCQLAARGVRVRILTNSLLSNDEVAVFAGYAKRREELLRCGVELHELRTDANFVRKDWPWLKSRSEANLHTKAAVFDRSTVLVGSFNMDPRSKYLNTELAILVESPELAQKVAAFIVSGMSLENSYLLELDHGDIVWEARDGNHDLRFDNEPNAGFWRTIETDFLSLLPIDELL